jgi:predicted DNA binding CopG/RHH family protein
MRQTRRTKRVTVRLAEPLQHELADAAAADGRPLAEYVRWVLVEHAAQRLADREQAAAA